MDTSLIINAVNGNKKVTKAVSNINPEKDNQTLKTFAQMVNGLSTNTYVDATRINKQSVEEADAGGGSTGELTFTVDDSRLDIDNMDLDTTTIENGVRIFFEYSDAEYGFIDVTAQ